MKKPFHFLGVKGLVIGTRPDCVDDEKLAYIAYSQKHGTSRLNMGLKRTMTKR